MTCLYREGKSNSYLNGDYQKIGDILLANMKVLKVRITCIQVVILVGIACLSCCSETGLCTDRHL